MVNECGIWGYMDDKKSNQSKGNSMNIGNQCKGKYYDKSNSNRVVIMVM